MNKIKIEIKNRWTGNVLFEYEKKNNTIKDTLKQAVKEGVYLRGADLRGADLEGADLEGADLEGADLRVADLRRAYLEGVYLERADLELADLREADLREADLRLADLEGADLRGADLEGADLRGADLRGADLEGAYLEGAVVYYTDYEIDNIEQHISSLIDNTNIEKMEVYENHNQIPTRFNCIWKNVLVVKSWTLKENKDEPKKNDCIRSL